MTPDTDRLVADAEELGDLGDIPTGHYEIEDLAAEAGRIAAGHHEDYAEALIALRQAGLR